MDKKKTFLLVFAAVFLGLIFFTAVRAPEIGRSIVERVINRYARGFFEDSIRIQKVTFDRHGKVRCEGVTGVFRSRQGLVPLEMRSIGSRESLFLLLRRQPVRFIFEGVKPAGSLRGGLSGEISVTAGKDWRVAFTADFKDTGLEDFRWLDPGSLAGASGAMKGTFTFVQAAGQEPVLDLNVEAPQPGGELQARFFDIFLPYLPASVQKERVARLVTEKEQLVRYQTAALEVGLSRSDRIKILLRILVLDYNLKLTLNVTVRTDQKDPFSQLARLIGLIEVRSL